MWWYTATAILYDMPLCRDDDRDHDVYKYKEKNNRLGGAATGTILKNKLSIFLFQFFHAFTKLTTANTTAAHTVGGRKKCGGVWIRIFYYTAYDSSTTVVKGMNRSVTNHLHASIHNNNSRVWEKDVECPTDLTESIDIPFHHSTTNIFICYAHPSCFISVSSQKTGFWLTGYLSCVRAYSVVFRSFFC